MLSGWVSQMVVFIIWKLEWMKTLFKLTFKREVVTALLKYNFFDYFFQVLFVNTTAWMLLWILTLFRALNISVNTTHPEILQQSRFKWETKFNWRSHEKDTGPWNIYLYSPLGHKIFFEKFVKPSSLPTTYLM